MERDITINIKRYDEDGRDSFIVTSPDLEGLVTEGSTIEEAIENAKEASKALIEAEKKQKEEIAKTILFSVIFNETFLLEYE